ncbi:MAG: right-handed parallel beta-helix repeat-containing protein [Deltaproteobacteria bacterium]|nr:right-handed parallel beta-helix repeat-containing protein [Deltaproteobacteria bacterium]
MSSVAAEKEPCGRVITASTEITGDIDCRDETAPSVLVVGADDVTVTCRGGRLAGGSNCRAVVDVSGRRNAVILGCEIVGCDTGIFAENAPGFVAADNAVSGFRRFGIEATRVNGFQIDGNRIDGNGAQGGIELRASDGGKVSSNVVRGLRLNGIGLYGASRVLLRENHVRDIGDTCFGFFGMPEENRVTHHVQSVGNRAAGCRNIGAHEIMFGSHDLHFAENVMRGGRNGFLIYHGDGRTIHAIDIVRNRIEGHESGVNVAGDTERVRVRGNLFAGALVAIHLQKAGDVDISENVFLPPDDASDAALLEAADVRGLRFSSNEIGAFRGLVAAKDVSPLTLDDNFWRGCPNLSLFSIEGGRVPDFLGVMRGALGSFEFVDEDGDGADDGLCLREEYDMCTVPSPPW